MSLGLDYVGGGYFRARGVPVGERAAVVHAPELLSLADDAVSMLREARDHWLCAGILKNERLIELLRRADAMLAQRAK